MYIANANNQRTSGHCIIIMNGSIKTQVIEISYLEFNLFVDIFIIE